MTTPSDHAARGRASTGHQSGDFRRAVVTGGGGGLGRAFSIELARRGGSVLVADRDLAAAEQTASLAGASAHATACDVSRLGDVEKLLVLADEKLGGVDLLVNNAGVAVAGAVGEVPIADWEWIVGVNLWGVVYGCHVFVPRFKQQRSGQVLNVASAAGLLSAPTMGPYNVTKAAVVSLSETLSAELRELGVGVTVLCPTFFRTQILASSRSSMIDRSLNDVVEQRMSASKLQADDVARIALDACAAGALYVVPRADGRWAWRMKRLAPERYYRWMPRLLARMRSGR
jgi:NAD(P)-dependent dehydrogenase (short-subunit alcohol dehydrogenase family)